MKSEIPAIATPNEFFNQVIGLDSKLAVHQACNELLDLLSANYATSTISKKLTEYKKPFYAFKHEKSELNETIETKKGTNTQHIAARLLTLSGEQKQTLEFTRGESENARAGYNSDGDIKEINYPPIDIKIVIEKSLECLTSIDPHTIGAGILNLTGLRANEQNMPAREYPSWNMILERDMVVIDEFLIGFKGLSKAKSEDSAKLYAENYYCRATLAPAKIIVEAQKRFRTCAAVQAISKNYEEYRKGFMDTFSNRYSDLFGNTLSTLEAYDDNGNLVKANGTPHKGRAFYACAIRAILKEIKGFKDSPSSLYIKNCLAHESQGITIKYLGRYDEKDFVNPIDINIPTNVKSLGLLSKTKFNKIQKSLVNKTETKPKPKTNPKNTFDIDAFITGLPNDLQVKFAELMSNESSLTNAILGLISISSKEGKNTSHQINKVTVSDEIKIIIAAIIDYNSQQTINTNCVVPTYALINKISERYLNKSIAKSTVDTVLKSLNNDITTRLNQKEITGLDIGTWNGKHHRKTLNTVIDSIVTILNK